MRYGVCFFSLFPVFGCGFFSFVSYFLLHLHTSENGVAHSVKEKVQSPDPGSREWYFLFFPKAEGQFYCLKYNYYNNE
jgi:hypothetical protein